MGGEKQYTLREILDLYFKDRISKNDKFVYTQEDYEWSKHGNFYQFEITLEHQGLWREVYDKRHKMCTCNYVTIGEVKNSNRLFIKTIK